ncbi:DUF4132 domain-containing protein [Streptomyces pini]|nr:DUF4132 domain-containing protein [Streptomyces pini]
MSETMAEPSGGVLAPVDAWARAMREHLAGAPPEAAELVAHLVALEGTRPEQAWKRHTLGLLRGQAARAAVREGVRLLARCAPGRVPVHSSSWDDRGLVGGPNIGAACGVVWAAALTGDTALLPGLLTVGRRTGGALPEFSRSDRVIEALIHALAQWRDPAALEALWTLHRELPPGGFYVRQFARVLPRAANRLGVPEWRQAECTVPAHGLGAGGSVAFGHRLGRGAHWFRTTFSALVTVEDAYTVSLVYADEEVERHTVHPFTVPHGFRKRHHTESVDWVRRYAGRVLETVNGERERLRGLSGTGRTWAFQEWARLYRDHPVTGAVVRGLVWEFEEPDGTWAAARPAAAGELVAARGTPPAPEGGAGVRLWSSAGTAAGEADAWRKHFAGAGVRPSFEQ